MKEIIKDIINDINMSTFIIVIIEVLIGAILIKTTIGISTMLLILGGVNIGKRTIWWKGALKVKENSIEEDMEILEEIIKGDEDCINAIYSQMKVKNDNDEDIQYYKKEIQSIKNIVDNYLKEKARADKLEKEYSAMLTELDENECDYKRVLKENEELKNRWDKDTHILQNDLDIANAKNIEKDKIIDLMSEQLITPIHDKKWIKKYYENKVNGGNER